MGMRKQIQTITERKSGVKIAQNVKNSINKYLTKLSKEYYRKVPIDIIIKRLKEFDVLVVDEDELEWQGFLSGREGNARLDLFDMKQNEPINNAMLIVTWYKMESGNFEVVAYIS
jgi:hypothetical protein